MNHSILETQADLGVIKNTDLSASQRFLDDFILDGALAQELRLSYSELNLAIAVANSKLRSGNKEKALSIYTMVVLCQPLCIEFQCGLANCALQMQEYDLALQAASAVIGLGPKDCRGYYISALACLGLGKFEEAREDISDALKFAGDKPHGNDREVCSKLSVLLNSGLD